MKSIGIIVFYFGKYPWYHDFFIDSCKRNQSIDFLFFTDNVTFEIQEKNIKFIPFSIDSFNQLGSKKLGFNVNVLNGLKICDFRPAFGVIFREYLKNYDYWGYSDTDIIYGNLRNFLDDYTLTYDYISVRDDYPSGYFSVFKNENRINLLYTMSKDYKELFLREENTLFEECGGAYSEVCNGINILNSSCKYETFHHILEKNKDNLKILLELFSIEGNVGEIKVLHNKMIFMKKFEIMMYHLTSYKTNLYTVIPSKLLKPVYYIHQYNFNKHRLSCYIIYCYLRKLYLFNIGQYFSYPLKQNIILNGSYVYMNEIMNINNNFITFKNINSSIKIKKVFFTKFCIFNNKLITINSNNCIEIYISNGSKKKFILLTQNLPIGF
jgi:hypothetical protein